MVNINVDRRQGTNRCIYKQGSTIVPYNGKQHRGPLSSVGRPQRPCGRRRACRGSRSIGHMRRARGSPTVCAVC